MLRLDHYALRVKDRYEAAEFYIKVMGYKLQTEFDIKFDDGTTASCLALEPVHKSLKPFDYYKNIPSSFGFCEYHLPPEIFISDGDKNSIINKWVEERNGIGGIHHIALQTDFVDKVMQEWKSFGIQFESEQPLVCDDLIQIFTKPLIFAGGLVYELITRKDHGFCSENVKKLMLSTSER